MKFYLGIGDPTARWLVDLGVPVFVSYRRLLGRKTFHKATASWALDSGGYSEIAMNGGWVTKPTDYVAAVRRYAEGIGMPDFAAQMDWVCDPDSLAATGLSIPEHQRRTVDNYVLLRDMAPDLPILPVLQGWEPADYLRCVDLFTDAGVDLAALPRVGLGSVVRRQGSMTIEALIVRLATYGIRLHGLGVKAAGIKRYGYLLASADSRSWSNGGRFKPTTMHPGCKRKTCNDCPEWALIWRERVLRSMDYQQIHLAGMGAA